MHSDSIEALPIVPQLKVSLSAALAATDRLEAYIQQQQLPPHKAALLRLAHIHNTTTSAITNCNFSMLVVRSMTPRHMP